MSTVEMDVNERAPRVPVNFDDDLSVSLAAGTIEVSLLNISVGGMAILAPDKLGDVDDWIVVEIKQGENSIPLYLPCRLRYVLGESQAGDSVHPRWLCGAKFERLSPQGKGFVDHFVTAEAVN